MQKHLFLCRHAQTQEADNGQKDIDRQLTPSGVTQAAETGAFISSTGLKPDLFLCSAARRTRETAAIIAEKINYNAGSISFSQDLYNASTPKLLQVIAELPAALSIVILVGHNPGISELASQLINDHRRQVPTGGCCHFTFDGPDWEAIEWADVKYNLSF